MSKHEKTLSQIFRRPPPATLSWHEVTSLFSHLGAIVSEAEGSRVRVLLNGVVAVFHRPHPGKEIRVRTIKDVRDFLENAGINP